MLSCIYRRSLRCLLASKIYEELNCFPRMLRVLRVKSLEVWCPMEEMATFFPMSLSYGILNRDRYRFLDVLFKSYVLVWLAVSATDSSKASIPSRVRIAANLHENPPRPRMIYHVGEMQKKICEFDGRNGRVHFAIWRFAGTGKTATRSHRSDSAEKKKERVLHKPSPVHRSRMPLPRTIIIDSL